MNALMDGSMDYWRINGWVIRLMNDGSMDYWMSEWINDGSLD